MSRPSVPAWDEQLTISPCKILPTEVVAGIFEYCLPSGPERLDVPLQRLAPLTLTWVCKSWRNLCLSLPTLWTELAIGHNGSIPEEDVHLLELWIVRSGYLPISLRFNYEIDDELRPVLFNQEEHQKYQLNMQKLLSTALECIERWSTFEIHALDISVLDQIFLAIVTRGSPWLKDLSFSTKYLGFFGDVYVIDFSLCPSLRSIRLRSPMISPVSESDVMQNMTRLELRFCSSVEDCLHWINICPALEELIVRLFCSNVDALADEFQHLPFHNPRCLQRLKYLEVHNFSSEVDVGGLLDVLDTPALDSLTINMYDMIESWTRWTHLLDLLRRSEPSLETLNILGTPMTMEDTVQCLQLLPNLKKLGVGTRSNTDMLLKALFETPESAKQDVPEFAPLCPILNLLDLVNCSWSTDLLASIVSSRSIGSDFAMRPKTRSVSTLSEIRLDHDNAQRARQHPVIMSHVLEGLKIVECETNLLILSFASPDVVFV
ncbi:hypothetical protein A7U60_g2042 [Sanghuangporus baumii]|uniref:F-box domain-containing protein n=1 Tax=Sanghuangporus baumii TaxID=108892 RepID=A0A9Q5I2Z2_SANBA|nr:hypothetical protein A7U60_g2042 [Sanghuangporus baumii]